MEDAAYLALAESEESGWYYQARRQAVETLLRCYLTQPKARILDIGCGTGGSTRAWQKFGEVTGVEPSALARRLAAQRFPQLPLLDLSVEQLDPKDLGSFEAIIVLCVLYHKNIERSDLALQKIAALQKPGSILIWNEPAFPFLWRQHDRQTAAGRRFYPKEMRQLAEQAGYEIVFRSHLLAWAFPIAVCLSLLDRWRWGGDRVSTSAAEGTDHRPVPGLINQLLRGLTFAEWSLNRWHLGLPFGVSHLLVARKKANSPHA